MNQDPEEKCMSLYLIETILPPESERDAVFEHIDDTVAAAGGELIELQASIEQGRLYAVVEHHSAQALETAFGVVDAGAFVVSEVRLVGPTLDEVKAARGDAGYLVEWDFPSDLTMDVYLANKKAKAPRYAQVPETTFLRTYVCEDMTKCLCFYDAPSEAAVLRAREVVDTPVTRVSRVTEAKRRVRA
jgi:hypothetical protein